MNPPSLKSLQLLITVSLLATIGSRARGDEGMWLYNQPPRALLKERYGFEPSSAWLEHLQKSSVNVGGASGSFVSPDGLLLSNQHVASRALQRISTPEHNYVRDGFYAKSRKEEMRCPGLEISVLMEIEDVTERVNGAVRPGMSDETAFQARRAAMAGLEKVSQERTGLRSEIVTLFQGAEYHLYRFKRYTDVRLVLAPEEQIAFFGGDADNFEYPRFDLDIVFLRAYENGEPAHVQHYLQWSASGAAENELVFISGHPARTDRLRTVEELKRMRDIDYPRTLERLKRTEVLLAAYGKRNHENERRARADLRSAENGRKRRDGTLAGLLDPKLIAAKTAGDQELRAAAGADSALASVRDAFERIARAQQAIARDSAEFDLLESGSGFNTMLFTHARRLVRAAMEREKPDGERLEEFRSSAIASVELALLADQPFYSDLETLKLADSLTYLVEKLGVEHPMALKILGGKSPRDRANESVCVTKLGSTSVRRQLFGAGQTALTDPDPMLELARCVDTEARAVRSRMEAQTEAVSQAHAQIGKARYATRGSSQYPDATGTLRLAFGTVKGNREAGLNVPFQTTFAGLYERASTQEFRSPFELPTKWIQSRRKLDLTKPLNFVSTCDTLGGNSGSPVVNRNGELVGTLFDGNIYSLVLDVQYGDERARSVSVHSSGILEALRKVYKAEALVAELLGRNSGGKR